MILLQACGFALCVSEETHASLHSSILVALCDLEDLDSEWEWDMTNLKRKEKKVQKYFSEYRKKTRATQPDSQKSGLYSFLLGSVLLVNFFLPLKASRN